MLDRGRIRRTHDLGGRCGEGDVRIKSSHTHNFVDAGVGRKYLAVYSDNVAYFKKKSLRKRIVLHEFYHHLVYSEVVSSDGEEKKAKEYAKKISAELSGSFEQEISTDLEELQANIREIFDNLESVISEAKTLRKDFNELETSLRAGLSDEENYKTNSEHIQDGKRQEREEEKQDLRNR